MIPGVGPHETAAKNKLFKNIKYESTQEINLFFYSYSRIL